MKTFLESMQVKAKDNFVESAFFFMHNNGVNPKEFVDWYGLELVHMPVESHKEICENWLNESFGNWVGQKVGSVVGNVAKNVGGFIGGVGQGAMNSMMPNTQGQQPTNSPQQYPPQQAMTQKPKQVTDALQALSNLSKYSANYPQDFYNALHSVIDFLNRNNFTESIRQDYLAIIEQLEAKGINSKEFTEWFLTEGVNLNEEGFWQGLKDTVGAGWAGLKNVANNFGNNMATAGNQYLNQKQLDRTNAAREQLNNAKTNAAEALKKLNAFLKNTRNPNYADVIRKMGVIYKAINPQPQNQQPQQQNPQQQNQQPAQQPQVTVNQPAPIQKPVNQYNF